MATDNNISIRALRHETRHHLAAVFVLLEGQPDLPREERLARLEEALKHTAAAADHLAQAIAITTERDDAMHAQFKAMVKNAPLN